MPSAEGFIECKGGILEGNFSDGHITRYITAYVKTFTRPFECHNATLTYNDFGQLLGDCTWKGTIGRSDLQLNFGGGVSIVAPLVTPRPPALIRGTGTWNTVNHRAHHVPVNAANGTQNNVRNLSADHCSLHDPVRDVSAKIAREQRLLESNVPIIAIFGQSGAGKSTFINLVTSEKQDVSRGLHSCTKDVNVVAAKVSGKPIVIIDTPGIDDTRMGVKESDALTKIANFFGDMGKHKLYVTGVLFMHRISDNRFSHAAQRISLMFKSLCGDAAMPHLMLCTTMWDKVSPQEGNHWLGELCMHVTWREMISMGASTATMSNVNSNAKSNAERIVCELIENAPTVELAIQHEMVTEAREAAETSAGKVLSADQKKQDESDKKVKTTGKQKFWRRIGCVIQ